MKMAFNLMKTYNNIVINGMVSPRGLGDGLQYYTSIKLFNSLTPESAITFLCPRIKENLSVFQGLNFNSHIININPLQYLSVNNILNLFSSNKKSKNDILINAAISKTFLSPKKLFQKFYDYLPPIISPEKLFNRYMSKHLQFNAGMIGGHTFVASKNMIAKYQMMRSIVKGPIVTAPISISSLSLKEYNPIIYRNYMRIKVKNILKKFEFIYARGPYSLKILQDKFNLEQVDMALDTGFGARLFFDPYIPRKGKKRIILIPRGEYFNIYGRKELYKFYLNEIAILISWLYENVDCEIILSSTTINREYINDLLNIFHQKQFYSILNSLRIVIPNSIVEMCDMFRSSDLVITSYMHGGITPLALGVPAFFILPFSDVKLLDILAFLDLDRKTFAIDMFNRESLKAHNLIDKIGNFTENLEYYKKIVNSAIDKRLITLEHPIRSLINLQNGKNQ